MAKEKPKNCPECGGPARGRGYTHASTCVNLNWARVGASKATLPVLKIDGRTTIPKLLKWQAEIEAELKKRKPADIKAVRKAIDEIESLEERLAEAKQLAGL